MKTNYFYIKELIIGIVTLSSSLTAISQTIGPDSTLDGDYTFKGLDCPSGQSWMYGGCGVPTATTPPVTYPTPAPTPAPTPSKPTPWYVTNARTFSLTWNTAGSGKVTVSNTGSFSGTGKEEWCVYNNAPISYFPSKGCYYNNIYYPVTTPGVTFVSENYNFVGTLSVDGQLTGSWATKNASGGMAGLPSGSSLTGNFTSTAGNIGSWVAR